jgi:hypothetical protein
MTSSKRWKEKFKCYIAFLQGNAPVSVCGFCLTRLAELSGGISVGIVGRVTVHAKIVLCYINVDCLLPLALDVLHNKALHNMATL